jgi:hypothetical protein
MQAWAWQSTYLIGPGCILAILLRLRRPLRLGLLLLLLLLLLRLLRLLLLNLLRWLLLLLLLLLLWRRWRLCIRSLLLLRLLRRLVRVPLLRRSGLLVVHVAHGGGGGVCDEPLSDGEVYRLRRRAEGVCESRQWPGARKGMQA